MDQLVIPLSSITARTVPVSVTVCEADLRPEEAEALDLGPITIKGNLSSLEPEYLFIGTVTGAFRHACDRCLQPTEEPFAIEITLVFEHGTGAPETGEIDDIEMNEEDAEGEIPRQIHGDVIDLREALWEEIALARPSKVLCSPGCAGLCPTCGANLNQGACSCAAPDQTGNLGFAGLADMFPNLPDQREQSS